MNRNPKPHETMRKTCLFYSSKWIMHDFFIINMVCAKVYDKLVVTYTRTYFELEH